MQNIEFKAELRDMDLARSICRSLGALSVEMLRQTDTYFRIADGRLKKRQCEGYPPEYVFYHRPNRSGPKISRFTIYSEADARVRFGAAPLPVWIVVKKTRELFTLDGVRIHLDTVEGLGAFIEFEALVCPERSMAQCHEAIERLRGAFAPTLGEPISASYSDLLAGESVVGD